MLLPDHIADPIIALPLKDAIERLPTIPAALVPKDDAPVSGLMQRGRIYPQAVRLAVRFVTLRPTPGTHVMQRLTGGTRRAIPSPLQSDRQRSVLSFECLTAMRYRATIPLNRSCRIRAAVAR